MKYSVKKRGFTIVELLIVIVVIAILAAISIVAFNGVQDRAKNTVRENDFAQIKKALLAYNTVHGGVPTPSTYGAGSGAGGWDHSARPQWLSFLRAEHGNMPVDPDNLYTAGSDAGATGNRIYRYFCYNAGSTNGLPDTDSAYISYRNQSNVTIITRMPVDRCLTTLP